MPHTPIPGEEFAPEVLVCYIDEQTGPYFTPRGWDVPIHRRLGVRDPDDRRAIWRMAALALGIDAEEADTSILTADAYVAGFWALISIYDGGDLDFVVRFHCIDIEGATIAHATAALCAKVWGPKEAS